MNVPNKLAIVIVDMQEFFLQNMNSEALNMLISNQIKIIDVGLRQKIPFFVLEYKGQKGKRGKTIQKITQKLKGARIEVIIKEHNGGFTKTNLNTKLKDCGVKEILMMGINASGCVQDTAIGGLNRGYKILTSRGIIANSSKNNLSLSKKNERWFTENTTFFENTKSLVQYLT